MTQRRQTGRKTRELNESTSPPDGIGDWKGALEHFRVDEVNGPPIAKLKIAAVKVCADDGHDDTAVNELIKLLGPKPVSDPLFAAAYQLAECSKHLGLAEEWARQAIERGVERPPFPDNLDKRFEFQINLSRWFTTLGYTLYRQGRLEDALVPLESAVMLVPAPVALTHLGLIYHSLGRKQDAVRHWRTVVRMMPGVIDQIPEAVRGEVQPLADASDEWIELGTIHADSGMRLKDVEYRVVVATDGHVAAPELQKFTFPAVRVGTNSIPIHVGLRLIPQTDGSIGVSRAWGMSAWQELREGL